MRYLIWSNVLFQWQESANTGLSHIRSLAVVRTRPSRSKRLAKIRRMAIPQVKFLTPLGLLARAPPPPRHSEFIYSRRLDSCLKTCGNGANPSTRDGTRTNARASLN